MFPRRCRCLPILGLSAIGLIGVLQAGAQIPPSKTTPGPNPARIAPARPYLGMRATSAGELAARQLGIESPNGAVVLATDVAGPSEEAGLRRGDLIVEFAGKDITQLQDLVDALAASPVGSTQPLVYVRGLERKSGRIVIGGRAPEAGAVVTPGAPPNSSPTAPGPPSSPTRPQPPPGWVERSAGNLTLYLPPDWNAVPFLASDEGCWFHGPSDAKTAVFAVIRDVPKEELLGPMKVEREEPATVAGREAVGFFGPTLEQRMQGTGRVVIPTQREADRSLLALLFFASGERWNEYDETFRTILSHVRNRPATP